ncbi:MAG: diacylglycerol/polyprenol kinase family protein [Candidatus Kapaibacterium sp.]
MTENRQITYRSEVLRKGIHFMSLTIPVMYAMLPKSTVLAVLVPLTTAFVVIDIAGHRSGFIRTVLLRYFGFMMRTHELEVNRMTLNGASYVLIAACACIMVFPKLIAVTAFAILIVSDICAALVGRRFGRHRFLDKSLEGTLAFAVSAVIVVGVIARLFDATAGFVIAGFLGSLVGAVVENLSPRLRLDDNVSIPFSIGAAMWVVALFIGDTAFVQ